MSVLDDLYEPLQADYIPVQFRVGGGLTYLHIDPTTGTIIVVDSIDKANQAIHRSENAKTFDIRTDHDLKKFLFNVGPMDIFRIKVFVDSFTLAP